jgi:TRAP-type C4-dicarboxylate transport system substrate-binding protein
MLRTAAAAAALTTLAAGQALAADPVLIRMANSVPLTAHMNVQIFTPWCERVTAQSEGTTEVKLFPSNAIATSENMFERIQAGVVDIGFLNTSYFGGKFNKSKVTGLPLQTKDSLPASIALWNMAQPGGILADEWTELRPLAIFAYPGTGLVSTTPIRRMEDLAGKKVSTGDRMMGQWIQNLGAAPITLPYSQAYESLNRGVVNVFAVGWTGVQPLKLWEVAKYYTAGSFGASSVVAIAMGKQSYEKLPAKGKQAVDRNSGLEFTKQLGAFWDKVNAEGRKIIEDHKGAEIFDLSDAEMARWAKAAEPVIESWVKETPNGAQVLAEFRAQRDRARANAM